MSYTKERKNPVTSILAHESVKDGKQIIHDKIITALTALKIGGTYEEIAKAAGLKDSQAWKRLSELEPDTIFKVGTTRKLSSGRKGNVWQLKSLVATTMPFQNSTQTNLFS